MGFLTLGRRFLNNQHDIIDDRIDVVTRGLMGLTVACARCHDHKFDPIPTEDYYSLYGVFASSTEPTDLPLIEEVKRTPAVIAFEKEVAKREADYQSEIKKRYEANLKKLREPQGRGGLPPRGPGCSRDRRRNRCAASCAIAISTSLRSVAGRHSWARSTRPGRRFMGRWRFSPAIPEKEFAEKSVIAIGSLGKDPNSRSIR